MSSRTLADYLADATEDLARLHLAVAIGGYCDPIDLADALTRCERYAPAGTPQDRAEYHALRADIESAGRGRAWLADAYSVQRDASRGVIA